jgi:hypothetical protein
MVYGLTDLAAKIKKMLQTIFLRSLQQKRNRKTKRFIPKYAKTN